MRVQHLKTELSKHNGCIKAIYTEDQALSFNFYVFFFFSFFIGIVYSFSLTVAALQFLRLITSWNVLS